MIADQTNGAAGLAAGQMGELARKEDLAEKLPPNQQAVLEILLSGKSIVETVRSSGVARSTLYHWLTHDPVFRAAYNQWHNQLRESCRSRLMTLTDKATDAIEKALEAGDAKSALQLLKGRGIIRDEPAGLTDPADVKLAAEVEVKKRRTELGRQMNAVAMDDVMRKNGF